MMRRWLRRLRFGVLGLALLSVWMATPAMAVTLSGHASTYASDPVTGFVDHADNNLPALSGATNDQPGIAILNQSTLGLWWRVCSPWHVCRWVRQTDIGPASFTLRVLDINSVAVRVLWQMPQGDEFPTDDGTWNLRSFGSTLTGVPLAQARYQRCQSQQCREKWLQRVHRARLVERFAGWPQSEVTLVRWYDGLRGHDSRRAHVVRAQLQERMAVHAQRIRHVIAKTGDSRSHRRADRLKALEQRLPRVKAVR